jgi:hypothetical protein
MPIIHRLGGNSIDTADVQVKPLLVDKVFEKGNGDPVIWERTSAPIGWWGIVYPTLEDWTRTMVSGNPFRPGGLTAADIEFSISKGSPTVQELQPPRGNLNVAFAINDTQAWKERIGTPHEWYDNIDDMLSDAAMAMYFVVTRGNMWGLPQIWTSGINVTSTWSGERRWIINGVEYVGRDNVAFANTMLPYHAQLRFVD